MRRGLLFGVVAAWLTLMGAGTAAAQTVDPEAASALVGGLAHDALSRLGAKGLTRVDRGRVVRDLLAHYSDEQKLAQQVLGRSWESASPEEQTRFENRLTEYLVAICAGMLKDLSPDTQVIVKGEDVVKGADARHAMVVVHTVVKAADDSGGMPVDWSVAAADDGHPFLADAAAEGVSLMKTMSSDFRSVLFANGGRIGALVAAMNQKITLADTSD